MSIAQPIENQEEYGPEVGEIKEALYIRMVHNLDLYYQDGNLDRERLLEDCREKALRYQEASSGEAYHKAAEGVSEMFWRGLEREAYREANARPFWGLAADAGRQM